MAPPFNLSRIATVADGIDANRIALIEEDLTMTYGELDREANRVAKALLGEMRQGDRVAFVGRNSMECVTLQLGAARAEVVLVILNWRLHPLELTTVLNDAAPGLVVVGADFADSVSAVLAGSGPSSVANCRMVLVGEPGANGWDAWLHGFDGDALDLLDNAEPAPESVAVQLYTSGTTGRPKGAMLTRRGFGATMPDTAAIWELDSTSVVLSVLPMFHIAGVGTTIGALASGSTLVIDNDARAESMIRAIERHRVTNLVLASVMVQMLVEAAGSDADLSSLKTVSYGAAPISAQALEQAIERLRCRMMQPYGLTETTGILTVLDAEDHRAASHLDAVVRERAVSRLRSCGRARPGVEIRIVDIQTGNTLPTGGVGEVQARTARLMSGYANLPDATAEALLADGWFRTGDIGEVDADGYLFLRDRLKDTIISGGENIYPVEVEDALQWHPGIREVAVIGVPHDKWGETPLAVVVRAEGAEGQSLDADDVIGFARSRLAGYKVPSTVAFVDSLPRNATGKVLRRELRESHWVGHERRIN